MKLTIGFLLGTILSQSLVIGMGQTTSDMISKEEALPGMILFLSVGALIILLAKPWESWKSEK